MKWPSIWRMSAGRNAMATAIKDKADANISPHGARLAVKTCMLSSVQFSRTYAILFFVVP